MTGMGAHFSTDYLWNVFMYSGVAYGMYCGHKTELFLDNLCNQKWDNSGDHKQKLRIMASVNNDKE